MDNRPIGVFDSGLGGLTGVRELRKRLPNENIVYFGDTGRVPYGSRSPETILQYARQDIAFLLSKDVKCIMAACGTVSSIYPAAEAAKLPVPYLGVVDAARPGPGDPQHGVRPPLYQFLRFRAGICDLFRTINSFAGAVLLIKRMMRLPSDRDIQKARREYPGGLTECPLTALPARPCDRPSCPF
jgi:hypothetical protein